MKNLGNKIKLGLCILMFLLVVQGVTAKLSILVVKGTITDAQGRLVNGQVNLEVEVDEVGLHRVLLGRGLEDIALYYDVVPA